MKKTLFQSLLFFSFCTLLFGSSSCKVNNRAQNGTIITAFTGLVSTNVREIVMPKWLSELRGLIKNSKRPIAIAGGKYSMGGQIAYPNGLIIDMARLNRIVDLDIRNQLVTVQAGITWGALQHVLDRHNLAIKGMQSYSDFSVGGSLGVNAHGREIKYDPIVNTVKSIKMMLADGQIVKASRTENTDLFATAIGGYGLFGVIAEATLRLQPNIKIESHSKVLNASNYKDYFYNFVLTNKNAVLHSAYLDPIEFEKMLAITWTETDKPLTVNKRLREGVSIIDRLSVNMARYRPMRKIRSKLVPLTRGSLEDRPFLRSIRNLLPFLGNQVEWLNYEMSDHIVSLQPILPTGSVSILQEYFIPVDQFENFVQKLKTITNQHNVKLLNVGIRYVKADKETVLSYAPKNSFAFVLYIDVPKKNSTQRNSRWTQAYVNAALSLGGRYYLPYHPYPTVAQFQKAYPEYQKAIEIKKKYDPTGKFKNNLYLKYFRPKKG